MKTFPLLFLALCVSASAAPLQSPRAASVLKFTPMTKPTPAVVLNTKINRLLRSMGQPSIALTEPAPVMKFKYKLDINFTGCDTNRPDCMLYDETNIKVDQPAGYELTILFADIVNARERAKAAWFGAATFDRESEFSFVRRKDNRKPMEFFSTMTVIPLLPTSRAVAPAMWVNPIFGPDASATWRKK